jgi:cytidylate kinase
VICQIAAKGNCVIVGRCADYICKDMKNVYNIFLYADRESKIQEIMRREACSYESAQRHVREINKKRFQHYKYYTDRTWGMASNYNLCVDTGKVSSDSIVRLVKEAVREIESAVG